MAVTQADYSAAQVEAARSVLVEVIHLLGEYRDSIVVIGGWVPQLLLGSTEDRHVGSVDVDLALDHRTFPETGYATVQRLLRSRGYAPDDQQPFIFRRTVRAGGIEVVVEVDLLAGEYQGSGRSRRTQRVQDARPRKARGCDLAFEEPHKCVIEAPLPQGGTDSVEVRLAAIVPFLVMKGMALHDRLKEKDAYDIHYCLVHYPGSLDALIDAFRPHLHHGLVQEGLRKIGEKFASPEHMGPTHVADFREVIDAEERDRIQRDAYERVHYLLERLGVV